MTSQINVRGRKTVSVIAFFILSGGFAFAARGMVTHKQGTCDYFIVESSRGYDVLEWFGGHDPDKGDILAGPFESYGMKDVYDETADANIRVWVEDYDLTKEDALEKLVEHCE